MAKIKWVYPIEEIHGALKRGVMGAAMRSTKNDKGEQFNFTVFYGKRSTAVTSTETANRAKFAACAALVKTYKADTLQRATNQAAARAAGKTYLAYLWQKAGLAYAAAQQQQG